MIGNVDRNDRNNRLFGLCCRCQFANAAHRANRRTIGVREPAPGGSGVYGTGEEMQDDAKLAELNESEKQCPVVGGPRSRMAVGSVANQHWWPNQLNLKSSTRTLPCPTPWARSSTTPRSSRNSTWMP